MSTPSDLRAKLPMRDDLAIDRTVLANERTFLAYLRTALQSLIGGLTLLKFFDSPLAVGLGFLLMPIGATFAILGTFHYLKRRRRLHLTGAVGGDSHGI